MQDTVFGAWKGPTNDGFNDEWLVFVHKEMETRPFKRQLKEVYFTYQEKLWSNDITTK